MTKFADKALLSVEITMTMTEQQARALYALTAYGTDRFIESFYKNMGRACLQPHEAGLRALFDNVSGSIPPILRRADDARDVFNGKAKAEPIVRPA